MNQELDITWNITKKCFFNCQICATKSNRIELKPEEKQRVLTSLCSSKKFIIHELDFSGGDPLVDPDSVKIINSAQQFFGKKSVSVTTTWRGIESLNKKLLDDILYKCELTLDCDESDLWRKEFAYTLGNYEAIMKYGKYIKDLTINIPIGHNYSEYALQKLCDRIIRIPNQSIRIVLIQMMPVGALEGRVFQTNLNNKLVIDYLRQHLSATVIIHLNCVLRGSIDKIVHNCGMVSRKIGIDCSGNVYSCAWAGDSYNDRSPSDNPFYLGNLLNQDFDEIMWSEKAKQLSSSGFYSNTKCPLLLSLKGDYYESEGTSRAL